MGGVASVVRDRFRFRVYYVSPLFKITPLPCVCYGDQYLRVKYC
jgi:hypothetical protein